MEFWNKKVNVDKKSAARQVAIYKQFPSEKRLKIALDFANTGIEQTRNWLRKENPGFSELEINLEYVRLMYHQTGEISDDHWKFYLRTMKKRIRKDWSNRFRQMMQENNWSYDDIAKMGGFKNGKVIEATISRELPAFAKLLLVVYDRQKLKHERRPTNTRR